MADVRELIRRRSREMGFDPVHALTVAQLESSFNPRAVSPSGKHRGLYQFGGPEFSTYGTGPDPFDPQANLDAFMGYQGHAKEMLSKALGRDPTPQELYLAHQQGPTGAMKLLLNPDLSASEVVGWEAVKANGGTADMTASQFADLWRNKYDAAQKGFTGNDTTPSSTLPPLPPPVEVATAPEWTPSTGALGPSIEGDMGGNPAAKLTKPPGLLDRDAYYAQRGFNDVATMGRGLLSAGMAQQPSMQPPEIRMPTMQPIAPAPSYRPQGLLEINPFRRKSRGILG